MANFLRSAEVFPTCLTDKWPLPSVYIKVLDTVATAKKSIRWRSMRERRTRSVMTSKMVHPRVAAPAHIAREGGTFWLPQIVPLGRLLIQWFEDESGSLLHSCLWCCCCHINLDGHYFLGVCKATGCLRRFGRRTPAYEWGTLGRPYRGVWSGEVKLVKLAWLPS